MPGKKYPQSGTCGDVRHISRGHYNHYCSRAATSTTQETLTLKVEKFSIMASVLTSWLPEKAPELFTYQVSIVRVEQLQWQPVGCLRSVLLQRRPDNKSLD